ncbi:MAG: prepilin-type N-terminal cleavage/methylation domain-containing protein [Desulfobacterales bacterium]|nr:MAG: prepilin-type N-terminal cleavage/methylation domain-containing protein [Desulfobacterales bacterium]
MSAAVKGYTLIELMVVIALISIMLVFSLPRFHAAFFTDDAKKASRWIIGKVQSMKEAALRDQKQYTLNFNIDTGRMWETEASMSQEALESAELNAYDLPEGMEIIDVEYPRQGKLSAGLTGINFYRAGYTDKALIHIQDGDNQMSFLLEPFLSKVKVYEMYASFDD